MLWEGIKLMVVGMSTVMIFLMLMIACIEWMKRLTVDFNQLEQEVIKAKAKRTRASKQKTSTNTVPVEVFAAAIAAYEADQT